MKRDFDLIRRILSDIENLPAGKSIEDFEYPEYLPDVISEHVRLLKDADLIRGTVEEFLGGGVVYFVSGLTWKGHDFLDAARNDSIWEKAKESVIKPTASVPFDVLLEWLKVQAKIMIGLPD